MYHFSISIKAQKYEHNQNQNINAYKCQAPSFVCVRVCAVNMKEFIFLSITPNGYYHFIAFVCECGERQRA